MLVKETKSLTLSRLRLQALTCFSDVGPWEEPEDFSVAAKCQAGVPVYGLYLLKQVIR